MFMTAVRPPEPLGRRAHRSCGTGTLGHGGRAAPLRDRRARPDRASSCCSRHRRALVGRCEDHAGASGRSLRARPPAARRRQTAAAGAGCGRRRSLVRAHGPCRCRRAGMAHQTSPGPPRALRRILARLPGPAPLEPAAAHGRSAGRPATVFGRRRHCRRRSPVRRRHPRLGATRGERACPMADRLRPSAHHQAGAGRRDSCCSGL